MSPLRQKRSAYGSKIPLRTEHFFTLISDPFGKGWLVKVRVEKPAKDAEHLMDLAAYTRQIESESH